MEPPPPSLEAMVRSRSGSPPPALEQGPSWVWIALLMIAIGAIAYYLGLTH